MGWYISSSQTNRVIKQLQARRLSKDMATKEQRIQPPKLIIINQLLLIQPVLLINTHHKWTIKLKRAVETMVISRNYTIGRLLRMRCRITLLIMLFRLIAIVKMIKEVLKMSWRTWDTFLRASRMLPWVKIISN